MTVLQDAHHRFADSPIRDYVAVLVERAARADLTAKTRAAASVEKVDPGWQLPASNR